MKLRDLLPEPLVRLSAEVARYDRPFNLLVRRGPGWDEFTVTVRVVPIHFEVDA